MVCGCPVWFWFVILLSKGLSSFVSEKETNLFMFGFRFSFDARVIYRFFHTFYSFFC